MIDHVSQVFKFVNFYPPDLLAAPLQEAKASYKCMDDNNYNRDACLEHFKAYKECKKRMVIHCV